MPTRVLIDPYGEFRSLRSEVSLGVDSSSWIVTGRLTLAAGDGGRRSGCECPHWLKINWMVTHYLLKE